MKAYLAVAVGEQAPRARILAALCAMLPRVGVADDGAFVCDLRGTERLLGAPLRVARNAVSACSTAGGELPSGGVGTTPFVARVAWQERFGHTSGWTSLVAERALFHFAALGSEPTDVGMRRELLEQTG